MAGAATGGAYSAGVMDFFMEAMSAWEAAKIAGDDVPGWSVCVPNITASSAGGLTATLAIASLNISHQPLSHDYKLGDPAPNNNPLFETWVKEMNYKKLFDCRDLDKQTVSEKKVSSILYPDFMTETAHKVLEKGKILPDLPHWASGMQLMLTATNMRGVPYSIKDFTATVEGNDKFHMRRYADYSTFQITTSPESVPGEVRRYAHILNLAEPRDTPCWDTVIICSRATSAFPAGFATVKVKTPKTFYADRLGSPPDWVEDAKMVAKPDEQKNPIHEYAAVDGGALNNEPFGILEEQMERRYRKKLDSQGQSCWGSLIMIDPFPGEELDPFTIDEGMPLLNMLRSLVAAIRGEAMFKENEIRAAVEVDAMEKFMIRPQRQVVPGQKYALATATLESFGGMLDEKIRLHDFMLGRSNCKDFLEKVFCISKGDALNNEIFAPHVRHLNKDKIPIIPVVGKAADSLPTPKWPTYSDQERKQLVDDVLSVVKVRISKLIDIMMRNIGVIKDSTWYNVSQNLMNSAGSLVSGRIFREVTDRIQHLLEAAVEVYTDGNTA